jgi:fatty-acyl-CoA synthase
MERTSCRLQCQGIEKGEPVAVMLKNCSEFLERYLASSRSEAIFVPINFRLAAAELN